jgi:hypothetical protein
MLPRAAACSDDGPTVPINNQPTLEPLSGHLDQRPESDTPDLRRRCRRPGACGGLRDPGLPWRARRRLLRECHPLPDRGRALAIPQRIQGHLHARVAEQRVVVQPLDDVPPRLDRHPPGARRVRPALRRQPAPAEGGKTPLPVIDHRHLDASACGHTAWTDAAIQEVDAPPARVLFCGLCAGRPAPEEERIRPSSLEHALGAGGGFQGERELRPRGERRERRLWRGLGREA